MSRRTPLASEPPAKGLEAILAEAPRASLDPADWSGSQRAFLDGLSARGRMLFGTWTPDRRARILAWFEAEVPPILLREARSQLGEPPDPGTPEDVFEYDLAADHAAEWAERAPGMDARRRPAGDPPACSA